MNHFIWTQQSWGNFSQTMFENFLKSQIYAKLLHSYNGDAGGGDSSLRSGCIYTCSQTSLINIEHYSWSSRSLFNINCNSLRNFDNIEIKKSCTHRYAVPQLELLFAYQNNHFILHFLSKMIRYVTFLIHSIFHARSNGNTENATLDHSHQCESLALY